MVVLLWAKQLPGDSVQQVNSVEVDAARNIVIAGNFYALGSRPELCTNGSAGGTNMLATWIARVIERNTEAFDHLIVVFHKPVVSFMERHPTLRAVLDGSWLGHPLHPAIIPIPIGAFTVGLVLDYVGIFVPRPGFSFAADVAYAFGLATVVPALITGLAEWSTTEGGAKRVAFVHATSNLVAGGFLGGSLLLRAVGLRGFGIVMSTTGYGVLLFGALLGGELAYTYAVGMRRHAAEPVRSEP